MLSFLLGVPPSYPSRCSERQNGSWELPYCLFHEVADAVTSFLSKLMVVCGNVDSHSALVPSRVQMFLVSFGHLSGL